LGKTHVLYGNAWDDGGGGRGNYSDGGHGKRVLVRYRLFTGKRGRVRGSGLGLECVKEWLNLSCGLLKKEGERLTKRAEIPLVLYLKN